LKLSILAYEGPNNEIYLLASWFTHCHWLLLTGSTPQAATFPYWPWVTGHQTKSFGKSEVKQEKFRLQGRSYPWLQQSVQSEVPWQASPGATPIQLRREREKQVRLKAGWQKSKL